MESIRIANNNHRNNNRPYPELVVSHAQPESDTAYYAALKLVARIDEDLTQGIRHYRSKAGVLLTTLDQVVNAILNDDLMLEMEEEEAVWIPQELAA
jgi:hypothetical protein